MPRAALGPRLYLDRTTERWIIRDGPRFIRTGTSVREEAAEKLREYRPGFTEARHLLTGFVYFVSTDAVSDFPIKIGFSERLALVRLQSLRTGCPYPLQMIGNIPGTYQNESATHRYFAKDRLCGEWFKRSPELLAFIAGGLPQLKSELFRDGFVILSQIDDLSALLRQEAARRD